MKNLLLGALFMLMGTFAVASSTSDIGNLDMTNSNDSVLGGWCEIRVYNSSGDLVDYSYTYEVSETACRRKANAMLANAEIEEMSNSTDTGTDSPR